MHKFTILTSLYKSELFLEDYFNTIFNQLILPNEIVLIDDTKNPNDLEEIINVQKIKHKFDRIILLKNSKNIGPTLSLNKGLLSCSNNLIFRLDVDDLWLPNHTKKTLEYYEKDKNYLIYSNSLKRKNLLTNFKCDEYYINENHLIHSSWLINRNVCENFKYRMKKPSVALEDYFTLLYYIKKKHKIFYTYSITAIYKESFFSHGKNNRKNSKYIRIRKKISIFFFYHYLKDKTLFKKVYFILFEYGLLKLSVLILWILDYLAIKRIIYSIIHRKDL